MVINARPTIIEDSGVKPGKYIGEYSWLELAQMSEDSSITTAELAYLVGQSKDVTFADDNTSWGFTCIGIGADTPTNPTGSGRVMTFFADDPINYMSRVWTSVQLSKSTAWSTSPIRAYMNGILSRFPSDLQNVIIAVDKEQSTPYGNTDTVTSDKLWLLSTEEIDTHAYSQLSSSSSLVRYSSSEHTTRNMCDWWLRDGGLVNTAGIYYIDSSSAYYGTTYEKTENDITTTLYIVPGFCI